jgi:hypothetical protein
VDASNLRPFIEQVRDHLQGLSFNDRVRETIYNHFLPQCTQIEISEDDFYKLILKQAFQEAEPPSEEDPDPLNSKGTSVRLFGVTLHSLRRLGEVLFEDAERQKIYFEDVTFLKTHVDQLQDADAAMEFARLYKSESDPDKRNLKICYRLHPQLPYRINGETFVSFKELLDACFKNRTLMNSAFKEYTQGRLHIWLHAQDAENYPSMPDDQSVSSFLKLVYRVNPLFPFYISGQLFDTPQAIAKAAKTELNLWSHLVTDVKNGTLLVWFEALGHPDWRLKIQPWVDSLPKNTKKGDQKTNYALVQQLLLMMDPEAEKPTVVVSEEKIELTSLAATEMIDIPIKVSLKNAGFVGIRFLLETTEQGLRLDQEKASLFDLTDHRDVVVKLNIDPQQLVKDKLCNAVLKIITDFETFTVPVTIKSVFPLRTYLSCLLKYAFFGGCFFALYRWMISTLTQETFGLAPSVVTTQIERSLPDNWPVFYWVFLALIVSLIGSFFLVRKVEKI